MKPLFNVSVISLKKMHDYPYTWDDAAYKALLEQLEVDDIEGLSSSDLLEMLLMSLQDIEPIDAADAVLAFTLKERVSAGVRQNIAHDLLEDQRPWEETSDVTLHAGIFAASVLLQKAVPSKFPKPDMMKLVLHVTAIEPESKSVLSKPAQPAFVARMLADGMNENSILERLFDEQLAAQHFPEAQGIIWHAEFGSLTSDVPPSAELTVYSSAHWLNAMESVSDFQSTAYNDTPHKESHHG